MEENPDCKHQVFIWFHSVTYSMQNSTFNKREIVRASSRKRARMMETECLYVNVEGCVCVFRILQLIFSSESTVMKNGIWFSAFQSHYSLIKPQ